MRRSSASRASRREYLQRREPQPVAAQSNGTLGGLRAPLTRGLLGPDYGWPPEAETGGAGRAGHEPTAIQRSHAADATRSQPFATRSP